MKTPGSAEGAAPARTRPVLRRLSLSLVALAFAVFAASALAGSFSVKHSYLISGSINASDLVLPTYAAFTTARNTCTARAPEQTVFGNFHYEIYHFQNLRGWWSGGTHTHQNTCVNVSLEVQSGSATAVGYTGPFSPSVPLNFIQGSVGGLGAGQSGDFEMLNVRVSSGTGPQPFDVIVYETVVNGGATYTLLVEGIGVTMTGSGPTAADGIQSFRASSAPKGVLVRWKTRSEQNALGFNVYRGSVKKVRLTRNMVRASGNGRGHTYSYIDRTARKGKAAPYYLEVVQRGGSKIMFGPAQAAQ